MGNESLEDTAVTMRVSMCVAMTPDRVIGKDGELPWNLPSDLRRFRGITFAEKTVIMGSKTFVSILQRNHGPLTGRNSIVLTRGDGNSLRRVHAEPAASVEEALAKARVYGRTVCVIGGGEVYAEFLPFAEKIYVTTVHARVDGDVFFPEIDSSWTLLPSECRTEKRYDVNDQYPTSYQSYVRIVR